MSEWKKYKLGDFADINMGQSPKSENYNDFGEGLPFLQGNRTFGSRYPLIDTYCTDPKKIANEGEILFSVRAPVADINIANRKICIGRGLASFNAKNQQNLFLFYLLHFIKDDIINSESGTVYGSVNKNDLESVPILLPPLPEQKAIASVLSSLDDKIDLLDRQNKTLEKMAETLFRQWFIEEVDDSWEEVPLGALFEISSGKGLKKEQYIENGIYPVLGANGLIGKTDNFLYDGKLIYTGRVGTLGNVFIIENEKVWLSDNTLVIRPHKYFYSVYFILKYSRLEEYNVGSTQPLIRQSDIKEIEFALPPEAVMNNFEIKADVLFSKIKANQRQIRTLERLRDTLLPKLMSGEVRIEYKTVK